MLPAFPYSARPLARTMRAWLAAALVVLLSASPTRVIAQEPPSSSESLSQSLSDPLKITTIAEQRVVEPTANGGTVVRYVPASQVRVGEQVHYTLKVQNVSSVPADAVVVRALPHNTRYVDGSAVGPGAEVSFSTDGGATFAAAQRLSINTYSGPPRRATADDYTHIRWRLRHPLAPGATALLRFRAEFR